mgnify:CR=1 FL=1
MSHCEECIRRIHFFFNHNYRWIMNSWSLNFMLYQTMEWTNLQKTKNKNYPYCKNKDRCESKYFRQKTQKELAQSKQYNMCILNWCKAPLILLSSAKFKPFMIQHTVNWSLSYKNWYWGSTPNKLGMREYKKSFSNFSCMVLNPNSFVQFYL